MQEQLTWDTAPRLAGKLYAWTPEDLMLSLRGCPNGVQMAAGRSRIAVCLQVSGNNFTSKPLTPLDFAASHAH